jgi:hypothetical protein
VKIKKRHVVKAYVLHQKMVDTSAVRNIGLIIKNIFYDKILPEKYLFMSQHTRSLWFQTCQFGYLPGF